MMVAWSGGNRPTQQPTRPKVEKTAADYAAEYERQAAAALERQEHEQEYQRKLQQRRENIRAMQAAGYYKGSRGGCFRYTSGGKKDYVSRSICNSYMEQDL